MKKTAAQPDSAWKDGFLFLGNSLALDFLNTHPIQNGEAMELLPDFDALVRWLAAAGLLTAAEAARVRRRWGKSDRAARSVAAARELRERLRKEVLAWESGGALHRSMVDDLNRLMFEHPMLVRLASTQNGLAKETWFATQRPEDLLAPVAHSAATLFTEADRGRVRKCE